MKIFSNNRLDLVGAKKLFLIFKDMENLNSLNWNIW
jgi:hypothetical protein